MSGELKPGFTVVMPTYNSGNRLLRCLDTIRGQDYPADMVQVIVADGGSTDGTVEVARSYGAEVVENPDRLAEYGLRVSMAKAEREFVVIFADDNGLVEKDWFRAVEAIFKSNPDMSALWCRLASGDDDPPINHYFAKLQNEPLSFFTNKYLGGYYRNAPSMRAAGRYYRVFDVDPGRPLVWGANGLVYRTGIIKPIWDVPEYLGDNDAFQVMLEQGHGKVGYSYDIHVYHHHVESMRQWRAKWRRNFERHFLAKRESRNLNWLYIPYFKVKVALWTVYSLVPLFSGADAVYRAVRERDWRWMYHPVANFLQAATYIQILLFTPEGREFLMAFLRGR